ncbi:MAG: FAD dependent oxidoreductase/FAD dependent oxidoreductase [Verrucomicrobia bacterium]|nr:MAG: FAD dependent oxidoreductase/FAD dependent oxidoreductase [Verrucomicrobiota bacterium]
MWASRVFVEAESFKNRGGWTVDTQFIEIMGSPYLLAHGMGRPVTDAVTQITLPSKGIWQVHVRTKDWVGPWSAPGAPGRFQVIIDGKPLATEFGAKGAEWHWQDGGTVEITSGPTEVRLHDLTGFAGRCDAIVFSAPGTPPPPASGEDLLSFRRSALGLPAAPPDAGTFDLVVTGGGYAGTAAAISGARQGLRVALIQNRPVLGGNGSSEVRVWAQGKTRVNEYPKLGEIVEEFADHAKSSPGSQKEYGDNLKEEIVRAEKNISLFLNHHGTKVEMQGKRIVAVHALDTFTGQEKRFPGKVFADCTGHGTIGALAGAPFTMAEQGHLGMSNMWYSEDTGSPAPWPETPWALELALDEFPEPRPSTWDGRNYLKGEWFWESGFDKHPLNDLERIRDWNLRAVYGAFSSLKRNLPEKYATQAMSWVACIGGNRESRLLTGDLILTGADIQAGRKFDDGLVATTWGLDLHYPKEEYLKTYKDNPFISRAEFGHFEGEKKEGYLVPYRCLYSREIENLFMAGRNISLDRLALGTTRVMRTCGMMGEVVGKAAWITVRHDTSPRGVYEQHLGLLKDLCKQPGWARRDSLTAELHVPPGGPKFLPSGIEFIDPAELEGIVIDDTQAKLVGAWKSGEGLSDYVGDHYLYHPSTGKGAARFEFFVKAPGKHEVRLWWQPHENRASNAPVVVRSADGEFRMQVNQRKPPGPNGYQVLGTWNFEPGQAFSVTLSNEGVDGSIHADAVQVVPIP